jgi:hypothetical protein
VPIKNNRTRELISSLANGDFKRNILEDYENYKSSKKDLRNQLKSGWKDRKLILYNIDIQASNFSKLIKPLIKKKWIEERNIKYFDQKNKKERSQKFYRLVRTKKVYNEIQSFFAEQFSGNRFVSYCLKRLPNKEIRFKSKFDQEYLKNFRKSNYSVEVSAKLVKSKEDQKLIKKKKLIHYTLSDFFIIEYNSKFIDKIDLALNRLEMYQSYLREEKESYKSELEGAKIRQGFKNETK